MGSSINGGQVSVKSVQCPYCSEKTIVDMPGDYAPVYVYCGVCSKRFILERLAIGYQLFRREDAPCDSDPDCFAIEMGASDEQ